MEKNIKIFIGITLVLLGFSIFVEQFDIFNIFNIWFIFEFFWPVLIIMIGVNYYNQSKTTAYIFLGVGVALLFSNILNLNFFAILISFIIIVSGLSLITGRRFMFNTRNDNGPESNATVILGDSKKKIQDTNFKGSSLQCILAGLVYDLRDSKFDSSNAQINIDCIMGNTQLFVPQNTKIVNKITAVLGESNDNTSSKDDSQTLTITGSVVMGSVEIKN